MRRVLVTAVTSLLVLGLPALAMAAPHKLDVCHVDGQGRFKLISVGQAAAKAHLDHGDFIPGDAVPGSDGYRFDGTCSHEPVDDTDDTGKVGDTGDTAVVFAVAYTDIDPDDGGYDPDVDVLIAKFIDGNDDGVPDGGDKVITNVYPTTLEPPFAFEPFRVTEHTILGAAYSSGQWTLSMDAGNTDFFVFEHEPGKEMYRERTSSDAGTWTTLLDWIDGSIDQIETNSASRSQPADFALVGDLAGDLQFLDVEILVVP